MAHYISASAITAGLTLTGHPVVALPCGLDHTGAPFGIQVVGRKHRDRFTLSVAMALEQIFSASPALARPVPDLESLAR
jgi:amidase